MGRQETIKVTYWSKEDEIKKYKEIRFKNKIN